MKICRTLNGLLKSIKNGENACLKYTDESKTIDGGHIIYLKNGTNLIISDNTYAIIKNNLMKVVN